jgi:PBSX family phage terminase large subunit
VEVKLLNHQYEVLADTETKIIGLVGGYGNGKTYTACRKAIQLCYLNPGFTGIVTEPTYPMLRDIFIPEMKDALEEWGIEYKFNASNSIFFLNINGQETKILCMSMENVERLVGVNAAWVLCDEFDTTKTEIAMKAFMKLLGRLRAGNVRQFIIFTTPEGFKATYKIFVEDNADGKRRLIKAKTTDNKYLPQDFIDTLREQYPPKLLDAYLNGEFVNLTSGAIYSYFKRDQHHTDEDMTEAEQLLIGQDFNIGGCVSIVYVKRGDTLIAVDEYESYDTRGIIENTNTRYEGHPIAFIPDASGNAKKTSASDTDIQLLRQAGFGVYVNSSNPAVKDRINTTNNLLEKGRLKVNTKKCPNYTKALEQHAYNEKGEPEKFNGAGTVDDYTDAGTYPPVYIFPIRQYASIKGGFNR